MASFAPWAAALAGFRLVRERPLAVLAWAVLRPRQEAAKLAGAAGGHWFGTRRAWLLALYFGLINGGYTSMVAWLPAYHIEHGGSAQGGADLVGLMTIFQVAGALGLPLLLRRWADRRPGLWLALAIQLVGFLGLLLAPAPPTRATNRTPPRLLLA